MARSLMLIWAPRAAAIQPLVLALVEDVAGAERATSATVFENRCAGDPRTEGSNPSPSAIAGEIAYLLRGSPNELVAGAGGDDR